MESAIKPCAHRGDEIGVLHIPLGSYASYACAIHGETIAPQCASCPDRASEKPQKTRDFSAIFGAPQKGERVTRWAVGMTTAPRRESTIARALASVRAAGFEPRIFAEPDSVLPREAKGLPIVQREERLGAWPNYFLGLQEMLLREPDAQAYMMIQDDVIFTERDDRGSLREYLEQALWPSESTGAVSLYTSLAYASDASGWKKFAGARSPTGKMHGWVWGACCFIWPRESLVHFLSHNAIWWRLIGPFKDKNKPDPKTRGTRNIDTCIGKWAAQHGKEIWHPSPSLCQHIGQASSIFPTQTATGKRKARDFLADAWR